MTEILIKRLSEKVKLPKYETNGSSGMDLSANIDSSIKINPGKTAIIPTGISLSVPNNYEIQIRPRSGLASNNGISVLNTPGTIDSDYRGELKVILINHGKLDFSVTPGMRVAQLIIAPSYKAKINFVKEISTNTKRGKQGFGSTGL